MHDPKCEELARHFLATATVEGVAFVYGDDDVAELSDLIQSTVELWFGTLGEVPGC